MFVQIFSVASGAIVLAAALVLAVIAFRTADLQRRATGKTLLVIYLAAFAPALIMSALWWRDAMRIMIELHGIAFRSESGAILRKDVRERTPGSSRVLIGDVPAKRRQVPQTLFGTLVFRPSSDDTKGTLAIDLPIPERRAGVIATSTHGILGAQEVTDGDRVCIEAECWTYDEGDDSFTSGKFVESIPPRQAKIPGFDWIIVLPFATPVTSGARTYSIDYLARHGSSTPPAETLRSFLCYSQPGARLRLVTLDAGVTLRKASPEPPQQFSIAEGTRLRFYTLPPIGGTFEGVGIAERRSVVYRGGARSFALDFDTPEVHSLSETEFAALHVQQEEKQKAVALAMGDAQLVDRSLYFSGTSESVALQSSALIELPRFFPNNPGSAFRVVSPRGPADATLGRVAWIGASDLAAVRMSVLRPPLLLLLAGLVLQLLKIASASAIRFTYAQVLIAGAVELLVGVRLLFGHRVWAMPPHRLEAAELGALAWMALPWIFIAASVPVINLADLRRGGVRAVPRVWFLPLLGLLFSAIFCARLVEGPKKIVWIGCHVLALAAVVLRTAEARQWIAARLSVVGSRLSAVRRRLPDSLRVPSRRQPTTDNPWWPRELSPLLWWAFAFFAARFILLLFGFKESAMLPGGRISLSAFYIPAAAVLQGVFLWRVWQRAQRTGRLQKPDVAAAVLMMTLIWGLPAVLTSDIGLALLNVPVFLLLLFAIDRRNLVTRIILVLTLIVVAGAPVLRVFLPMIGNEETLLSLASDTNYARFFHAAAPERLQMLATKRGESLAITSAILQRYINTGLFGVGYGHTEVSAHLGDTALRDFAPAVFVAAEWGLAGSVAMITLYALFGYVAYRLTPWSGTRATVGFFGARENAASAVACVAALTITVSSVYMILANHELVLLTGKNAYLLGLDSAGDVLEMVALLLVIAYCFAFSREAADATHGMTGGGFR